MLCLGDAMSVGFGEHNSSLSCHCHFIVNGTAGNAQRERVIATLKLGLPQLSPTLHEPTTVNELRRLIRTLPTNEDVVVAGGDGTLQCALPALIETRRPIVVLPLGTANDFATQWGFTPDLICVYQALSRRVVKHVDIIQCNDHYFATVGGLGVGALLARDFNALRRSSRLIKKATQYTGTEIYTALAAATIIGRRSYLREYRIETESDVRSGMFSNIFICNQPRLGGDMVVAPRAKASDGLFDVLFLKAKEPLGLLLSLADLRLHREPRLSERLRTQEMTIRANDKRENLFFADGEALELSHELRIKVHVGALSILTAGDIAS